VTTGLPMSVYTTKVTTEFTSKITSEFTAKVAI